MSPVGQISKGREEKVEGRRAEPIRSGGLTGAHAQTEDVGGVASGAQVRTCHVAHLAASE